MNRTSLIVERGVDELAAAGLRRCPRRSSGRRESRDRQCTSSAACTTSCACRGASPAEDYSLVIGRVVAVHIEDGALTPDGRLDVLKLRPIARLGYRDYSSIESTFEMEKPLREERR